MQDDKLTFGLVGCGNIGLRHANLISNGCGILTGVCDNNPDKARHFSNLFKVPSFGDVEGLLAEGEKPDVLVVCTPNYLHANHTIKGLESGCNVLCEKPMAISESDGYLMKEKAIQNGKLLYIVKQNRFNAPIMYLKALIETNRLNQIFSFSLDVFWHRDASYYKSDWKGKKELDGGILFTQFSHFIDLIIWLFGKVKRVWGLGKNFNHNGIIEFEDTIVVCMELESGIIGTLNFSINSFQKNWIGRLAVLAENGNLEIGGGYLNKISHHNIKGLDCPNFENEDQGANLYPGYQGSMSNHNKVYESFSGLIKNNEMNYSAIDEAIETVKVIQMIHEAIDQYKRV